MEAAARFGSDNFAFQNYLLIQSSLNAQKEAIMEPKMNILFIGKKSRITRHKLLLIYLRVTIEGKRFEAATHQHAKPSEWSPSAGRIIGR